MPSFWYSFRQTGNLIWLPTLAALNVFAAVVPPGFVLNMPAAILAALGFCRACRHGVHDEAISALGGHSYFTQASDLSRSIAVKP